MLGLRFGWACASYLLQTSGDFGFSTLATVLRVALGAALLRSPSCVIFRPEFTPSTSRLATASSRIEQRPREKAG